MNDSEKEEIDAGKKFHLPNGFNASDDPLKWLQEKQLSLLEVQKKDVREKAMQAIKDQALKQKPKHQGPEK